MSPFLPYSLLNTVVFPLYSQIHATTVVAFAGGHFQLKQHECLRNSVACLASITGLPSAVQTTFNLIQESVLPSFTSTANRYDTDTTAGALLLQGEVRSGVPLSWAGEDGWARPRITIPRNGKCGLYLSVQKMSEGGGHPRMEGMNLVKKAKVPKLR